MTTPTVPTKLYAAGADLAASLATAQAWCAAIHAWLIANDPEYAASVSAGQTTAWCVPQRDLDGLGNPIGNLYFVIIRDRAIPGCTSPEILSIISWTEQAVLQENMGAIKLEDGSGIINPG